MIRLSSAWRRSSIASDAPPQPAPPRFNAADAIVVSSPDDLAAMEPGFVESLSQRFDVEALASRLCPVLLADQSVAIFALAEHVGSDQADALAQRIGACGYRMSAPARYVLAAPLLLAAARNQLAGKPGAGGAAPAPSRTALADAFNDMVDWGVRNGASDLHLNVCLREPVSEVRFTLAGRYVSPQRFERMPTNMLMDMLSVAWMDISGGNGAVFDPSAEQQGSMTRQVDGKTVMLRWASLAADQGPSVCLRLLERDARSRVPGLEQLGYLPDQTEQIGRVMLSEGGVIIFSGTVGSGKSTSLASLICGLPAHRKVITIEDPVEYIIPGAIQNTVARNLDATAHQTYASKLRTLKRSAMTDVLLGEVRDEETGRALMDLAGSGVNVYTTVHAPSAAHIPQRLASDFIRVSRDFLATPGMLKLLVYQALLPVLCPHCARQASCLSDGDMHLDGKRRTAKEWNAWLELIQSLYGDAGGTLRVRNAAGCSACHRPQLPELNGYAGRTVVADIVEPAIAAHPGAGNEMPRRGAMECAVLKAYAGEIDPRDIEARFHAFETQRRLRGRATVKHASMPQRRSVPC
jgi:type II secretory ATPase GspE/PulE/Tfp pilus assembly ATPase PilB-like protein